MDEDVNGVEIAVVETTAGRLLAAEVSRHGFGGTDTPALIHGARRLKSPLCSGATTWLATVDGAPAASLLCYELTLLRGATRERAFGLGSVATYPEFRRRGLASRLCREVAERHGGAGLLFSAIEPAFYERLGYVVVPAGDFHCEQPAALAESGPRAELTPLDPRREVDRLAEAWDAAHDGWYLDRDAARWRTTLEINYDDLWYAVDAGGYLRVVLDDEELMIVECCTPDRDGAMRAAVALANGLRIRTWEQPGEEVAGFFEDRGRARTRPMVLGVEDAQSARFSPADYF